MSDGADGQETEGAQKPDADHRPNSRGDDARYFQQNLANRLFPGPSRPNSPEVEERVRRLLRYSSEAAAGRWPGKNRKDDSQQGADDRSAAEKRQALAAPPAQTNLATTEDLDKVREALDAQNELLRAILQSSVDTQEDARSTAQNSRTFAWAGTAIALLTLVATVISIVAAVRAN